MVCTLSAMARCAEGVHRANEPIIVGSQAVVLLTPRAVFDCLGFWDFRRKCKCDAEGFRTLRLPRFFERSLELFF